ncbi:Lipid-A-disaccharide synthase [hydrothermal vent metagenome]|uniref:lipid-A-disaccharide synthase n=1 Tax=hydrothermal vent metagenome TaxID=652676 RepID=A0A3B0U861_9ZZZZ
MTKPKVKLFVLAGEASGDLIGADLLTRLKARVDLELTGVGGARMEEQGLKSLFDIKDLSVMGYVDVIASLGRLLWRLRQTVRAAILAKPDIVVLIDAQIFSAMLAKRLKKRGFTGPILLYVAPTVWVYKPERAKKILPLFDEVLAVLPFEVQKMMELGGPPTTYVGHPALCLVKQNRHPSPGGPVALLPGSRSGELRRHLPMFAQLVDGLHAAHPDIEFFLPTLEHLEPYLKQQTATWAAPVQIVTNQQKRHELYGKTRLAVAVAGTATLELAFAGVPHVATYVMDRGQEIISKTLQFDHISLPNIILNEPLVPELLFAKADAKPLIATVSDLIANPDCLQRQIDGFIRLTKLMDKGEAGQGEAGFARQDPAERVLAHLDI